MGISLQSLLSSVAWLAVLYFSTLSHKGHNYRQKLLEVKRVFRFSLQFLTDKLFIQSSIQRDSLYVKYLSFFSDLNETWIFRTDFLILYNQISIFMKIRPLRVELLHADRQTNRWVEGQADMANLTVTFRDFSIVPFFFFSPEWNTSEVTLWKSTYWNHNDFRSI